MNTVVDVRVVSLGDYADGRRFAAAGIYQRRDLELTLAFDPEHHANQSIADLRLAPRDALGRVRCRTLVSLLEPKDSSRGNGCLLLDVPNRGRRLSIGQFNRVPRALAMTDPLNPGDGFLFERGFSLATVGWQWDIPKEQGFWLEAPHAVSRDGRPLAGSVVCYLKADQSTTTLHIGQLGGASYAPKDLDGSTASLVKLSAAGEAIMAADTWFFGRVVNGQVVASAEHVTLRGGFEPGVSYRLIFAAEGAPVVGCGLLAIRDVATWLRADNSALLARPQRVIAFGASQTGRFLRHFLYAGLNASLQSQAVFDGVWIHIAGGLRGDFNHRFAQPSAIGGPGFSQLFPFAATTQVDAQSGREDGLFKRSDAQGVTPKVFITNTAYEYWRGDASLTHINGNGDDIPFHPLERNYLFAGTQHIGGVFPPTNDNPLIPMKARYLYSVVDHAPLMRAALLRLDAWVRGEQEPLPSAVPMIANNSAQSRAEVLQRFKEIPDFVGLNPQRLETVKIARLDPDAVAADYPVATMGTYPAYVSAVDKDLNEIAGVRLPEVMVPLASYAGWNPRHPDTGASDEAVIFAGMSLFFAGTAAERAQRADPRPAIDERYKNRDDYVRRSANAAQTLVQQGWLIAEDVAWVTERCGKHFDYVMKAGESAKVDA